MSKTRFAFYSLKGKIIFLIGMVMSVLMVTISIFILLQWRSMIISEHRLRAQSVTRAISVSFLDAFIYNENGYFAQENYLQNYVNDFHKHISVIRYIAVIDPNLRILAHSDLAMTEQNQTKVHRDVSRTDEISAVVLKAPEYGWIIETFYPLEIGGKRWGYLQVGFDAEPVRSEIQGLFSSLIILAVIVLGVTLALIYLLIGRLTDSLHTFVTEMDKVDFVSDDTSDLSYRNDEIGILIHHFTLLKERLANSRQQLMEAQRQVYHAEKLASIGRLASGVSHEINNPLNGIRNCLYSVQNEPDNEALRQEYLKLIDEGVGHIEAIVKKLLGFARHSKPKIGLMDLNQTIRTVLDLLAYQISKKGVRIETNFDPDLPEISGDSGLIQEVVMNLLLNSYDAVSKNGIICVSSKAAGDFVIFTVQDNGAGIAPDELHKIFDPFYTTKEPGEGTGLGLSVSLGIIESHNGRIDVDSTPEKGTTFNIILPIK